MSQKWEEKVYGKPGPDTVRVIIRGQVTHPGIYYFKSGTTLESALATSDNLKDAYGVRVYNMADGIEERYQFSHLKQDGKARVLKDNDLLLFPRQ
jgi:protein involved in polysaccharide export with SLBB domain